MVSSQPLTQFFSHFQVDETNIGTGVTEIPLLPLQWTWLHSCVALSCQKNQITVVVNGVKVLEKEFERKTPCPIGWVVNVKSWPIISAIAKFTAFGPTFAIKIVSEPQKKFSSPWVCVWKNGFSHCRVKNQSCRRIKCDLSKPISRKMQDQWKKN